MIERGHGAADGGYVDCTTPRIVVGVDGSETARRALHWALDEARLRHGTVDVVHAWRMPYPDPPLAPRLLHVLHHDDGPERVTLGSRPES